MKPVVSDANLAVALLVNLPYSPAAEERVREWKQHGVSLYAPALWPSEVVSSLRKAVVIGQITGSDAIKCIEQLIRIGIRIIVPDAAMLARSLWWAERIYQRVAYDAQYLALAESLEAEFWTADIRLWKKMQALGVDWVYHIRQ
jgi:predicted nucleic acid-binding protein